MANHTPRNLKTFKAYAIGLILCLILTFMSFEVVARAMLPQTELIILVFLLAIAQFFVQVICFLRLNASREGRWELMPFLFTIVVVLIIVFGSMWIMFNLDYNMMH